MSEVVLSVGSNLGDRLGRLQAVVDGLGDSVRAVSPVFESDPWGGVEQDAFLNAVILAEDPSLDPHGWLARCQQLERDNERVRGVRWGPRTLDVDIISCLENGDEIGSSTDVLTLPHPRAHLRAFVLAPWLALDAGAELTVHGCRRPVSELLADLDADERRSVRPSDLTLKRGPF